MSEANAVALEFLKEHRLGVLATGRRDGSPQQALVAYHFDGTNFAIRTGGKSAKARNLRRGARASLLVADGGSAVTVYGEARVVDDVAAVVEYSKTRLRSPRETGPVDEAALALRVQDEGRVIIVLTPSNVLTSRL